MTEIEIRQNNGNQINIRADSEDSGLFYNGLFKMLSMPVEDFRDEHNTMDVEPKKPEPKPVEAKKPEPEPVEAKKPETKPTETKKVQNDDLPDIPEGVDPLEPPAEEIAEWSVSDFTERLRSMSDDVYDIAGDPARRELRKRIEKILRAKYNVRVLPSVPKDKWSKAYADVKRTYLILKEELINQNAAD